MPPNPTLPATVPCRECGALVDSAALTCPACEAPRPARAHFAGEGYEWKTAATWLGAPLIHVAFGMDAAGRPRTARGVIAIGQCAVGGVAIGITACGFLAIGVVAIGLASIGTVAVGALAAVGVNAFGTWAFGVVAIGWSVGGVETFSVHGLPGSP